MSTNYQKVFERDYQKLLNKYDRKSEEYKQLKYEYQLLQSKYNTKENQLNIVFQQALDNAAKKYQPLLEQKDKKIEEQDKEIARLKALLNIDGTNSGIPTSQTPINKKKVIPNTRIKSDKKIGGQPGHQKHKLEKFKEELYKRVLKCTLLYWDDTVIMIHTKRGCLRFYVNEKIAYYTAHNQKKEVGIKEDDILNTLSDKVTVMHDYNIINYKYSYQNIECNVHLIRDLEKCKNNTSHEWCDKFKLLVQKIIHDKNQLITNNSEVKCFDTVYINDFDNQYESILYNAIEENKEKKKT